MNELVKKSESKISIIVPVYKIESAYLKKCIESLITQSFHNLEIILVDDGSPDDDPAICDQYAERDRRITVIHKKNGGIASARNAALKRCTGEYVCFVDGDDHLAPDIIQKIMDKIKDDVDMVWFDTTANRENTSEYWKNGEVEGTIGFQQTLQLFLDNKLIQSCWAKFISKRCLKGKYLNEELKRGQDEEFIIRILLGSGKSQFLHVAGYFYNIRSTGATNIDFSPKVFNIFDATELVRNEVLNVYPEMYRECDNYVATGFWNMIAQYKKSTTPTKQYKEQFQTMLKANLKGILNSTISYRQKVILILSAILGPEAIKTMYQIYKKKRRVKVCE